MRLHLLMACAVAALLPAVARAADTDAVQRGAYVARTADCVACHTAKAAAPYSGGLAMDTPIGRIYSPNISPDAATGIGNWTEAEFITLMRSGIRRDGTTVYPAMPYPSYGRMSDQDLKDLFAFMHTGVKPVVEGIQEITVQTNSYAAEAGRTAGGVVSIITRSGTNKFHGTVYEFFRNDILDARNVLQTTGRKPELRQNQFGGSIGGPIFRNRTFFFGDYEGLRTVSGVTYTKSVPDQYEYNAINSLNGETPQTLINSGNGTSGRPVDPVALAYLKLFPAPNTPGCGVSPAL